MIIIMILAGLIAVILIVSWFFNFGSRDGKRSLDTLNRDWNEETKTNFTNKYKHAEVTRERYEQVISDIYGMRSTY